MISTHQYEMELKDGCWMYTQHLTSGKQTVNAKTVHPQQQGSLEALKKEFAEAPNEWLIFVFDNNLTAPSTIMQTCWKLGPEQKKEEVRKKLAGKEYMIGTALADVEWVDQLSPKKIRELTTDELDAEDEALEEARNQEIAADMQRFIALPEKEQRVEIFQRLSKQLEDLRAIENNPAKQL